MDDAISPSDRGAEFKGDTGKRGDVAARAVFAKPKPATRKLDARLPIDLVLQIESCAKQRGVCKTDVMRSWLEAGALSTGWGPALAVDQNAASCPEQSTQRQRSTPPRRKAPIRQRAYTPTDPALIASVAVVGNLLEIVLRTLRRIDHRGGVVEMTMVILLLRSIEQMASDALAPLNRRSIEMVDTESSGASARGQRRNALSDADSSNPEELSKAHAGVAQGHDGKGLTC